MEGHHKINKHKIKILIVFIVGTYIRSNKSNKLLHCFYRQLIRWYNKNDIIMWM
jgi:hypothetical protein